MLHHIHLVITNYLEQLSHKHENIFLHIKIYPERLDKKCDNIMFPIEDERPSVKHAVKPYK